MMTEEEAKTKMCPQHGIMYCAASACMAWRWKHKKGDLLVKSRTVRWMPQTGEVVDFTYETASADMGFCGLAGKP